MLLWIVAIFLDFLNKVTLKLCVLWFKAPVVADIVPLFRRFADFVEGSPHLMPNEVSVHVQEYGFGGSFFEDEFFDTDDEEDDYEEEIKPMMKPEWDSRACGKRCQYLILPQKGGKGTAPCGFLANFQTSFQVNTVEAGLRTPLCEHGGQICNQKWQSIVSKNVHYGQISSFFRDQTSVKIEVINTEKHCDWLSPDQVDTF